MKISFAIRNGVYTYSGSRVVMAIPVEMLRTCRCRGFGKRSELAPQAGSRPVMKESQ